MCDDRGKKEEVKLRSRIRANVINVDTEVEFLCQKRMSYSKGTTLSVDHCLVSSRCSTKILCVCAVWTLNKEHCPVELYCPHGLHCQKILFFRIIHIKESSMSSCFEKLVEFPIKRCIKLLFREGQSTKKI